LPRKLERLRKAAILSLKSLRRTDPREDADFDRAGDDALIIVMQAMSDSRKTAAVYFGMAAAMANNDGRELSDRDMAEAEELCRVLGQARLTDGEWEAIEDMARKRHS
jgi:hypothetical protein